MGAKGYLLIFSILLGSITFQVLHYLQFQDETIRWMRQGPRFTANDGQALCERIRALEKEPKPCEFLPKP